MKILDRTGLAIFSTIVLIISIVMCMIIFDWVSINTVTGIVSRTLNYGVGSKIVLGISIAFILLAIKCIFFSSSNKEKSEYKNGILLENSDGKLLITKDTLENLVNTIVKSFDGAENAVARIELDNENNLKVFVNISVKENAVIKELSSNIQARIKEAIKTNNKFLDDWFPTWRYSKFIKLSYMFKYGFNNLKIWIVKMCYKFHLFRAFLKVYNFMITKLKIDIKW